MSLQGRNIHLRRAPSLHLRLNQHIPTCCSLGTLCIRSLVIASPIHPKMGGAPRTAPLPAILALGSIGTLSTARKDLIL